MSRDQDLIDTTIEQKERATGAYSAWGWLTIVLGIIAMAAPFITGLAMAVVLGVLLIIAGSFQLAYALQSGRFGRGALRFLFGGITLAAGIFCITQSGAAAAVLGLLLAIYLVLDGCLVIASASQVSEHRGWLLAFGVISLLLGVLLWLGWPITGIVAIGILVGIRLVLAGIMMVILGDSFSELNRLSS